MHFHDKEVVVPLTMAISSPLAVSGEKTVNDKTRHDRFNLRDRTHTETLIRGKQHAIITELK
jgi:hypothetical protein